MSLPSPRIRRTLPTALAVACLLWLVSGSARAHEQYVVDGEQDVSVREFLSAVLSDPVSIALLVGGAVTVGLVIASYLLLQPFEADVTAFRLAMREYAEYVPWLLRISIGIPLIGAGFSGYFISPAVQVELRLVQVFLGFMLLFGLATRAVAVVTFAVYAVGVVVYPDLLLQLEVAAGSAVIAMIGSGKPSADHVLYRLSEARGTVYGRVDFVHEWARGQQSKFQHLEQYAPTVGRVGLGLGFIFLGVSEKMLSPGLGLEVVEHYDLTSVIPVSPELWVFGAGLAEIGLGTLLVLGAFTRASATTAIVMFTLTLFALPDDPVLAHVGLYGLASMLIITGSGPYAVDRQLMTVLNDWKHQFQERRTTTSGGD
jgi:uncharacterized membrane protein YphA (DoxX/SURF4 family)